MSGLGKGCSGQKVSTLVCIVLLKKVPVLVAYYQITGAKLSCKCSSKVTTILLLYVERHVRNIGRSQEIFF